VRLCLPERAAHEPPLQRFLLKLITSFGEYLLRVSAEVDVKILLDLPAIAAVQQVDGSENEACVQLERQTLYTAFHSVTGYFGQRIHGICHLNSADKFSLSTDHFCFCLF
jgi:hypothetical protein